MLPHMRTARRKRTSNVHGLAWEVCVVCIRFVLQNVNQFKSWQLLNMSNRLSCACQHEVNY
jgi:hypothetical protein